MFQPFTIDEGYQGFSKLCNPPTLTGSVGCVDGECWVRFLSLSQITADATLAAPVSGANANLTDPSAGPFIDGWIRVAEGETTSFGAEPQSDTAPRDPIVQIDIYCTETSTVIVNQH